MEPEQLRLATVGVVAALSGALPRSRVSPQPRSLGKHYEQ